MESKHINSNDGLELEQTSKSDIYYDKYSKTYYKVDETGKTTRLISTSSGANLQPTDTENIFYDPYIKKYYVVNEHGVLPAFIPDSTSEPAHVDGNYLVGNDSGRKFPIDDNGNIKMPYDPITISPEASTEEMNKYFEERKTRQFNMTQEEIDKRIAEDDRIDQEAIDNVNNQIYEEMTKNMSPEKKEETMFLFKMKEQVTTDPSKISEQDIARLISISNIPTIHGESALENSSGNHHRR